MQGAVASMPQDYPQGGGGGGGGTEEQKLDLEASLLTPALLTPVYSPVVPCRWGRGAHRRWNACLSSQGARGLSRWCPSCPASLRQMPLCPRSRSPMPGSLCQALAACSPVLLQACSWEVARRVNVHSPGKGPEVHQSPRVTAHRGVSPKAPRKF